EIRNSSRFSSFDFRISVLTGSSLITVLGGIMSPRRFLLIVIFVCASLAFYTGLGSNAQEPANATSPQMRKDAPYHTGGEYKPEATSSNKPHVAPVADHNAYPPVPLVKIDILPAAITISGAHDNQRLIVEGTFTDGHQEDLTAQATFASSNLK